MQKRKTYYVMVAVGLLLLGGMMSFGPERVMAALGFTPIRDVDNPGRAPYLQEAEFNSGSIFMLSPHPLAPVPAGKRLVITHVTASVNVPQGERAFLFLRANGVNQSIPFTQITNFDAFAPRTVLVAAEDIRAYADPGTTPGIFLTRTNASLGSQASVNMSVSGHYVNLP